MSDIQLLGECRIYSCWVNVKQFVMLLFLFCFHVLDRPVVLYPIINTLYKIIITLAMCLMFLSFSSSFAAGALVSSSRRMEVLCGVKLYFSDYRLLTYIFMGFLVISFVAATQIKFKVCFDEVSSSFAIKSKLLVFCCSLHIRAAY